MSKGKAIASVVVAGIIVIAIVGGAGLFTVPEGHMGVEKEWKAVDGNVHTPGMGWVVPMKYGVQHVEIRPRTYSDSVDVTTLNGTTFTVEYVVRYRINKGEVVRFVEEWNDETQVENRLIDPTAEDRLRKEGSGIYSSVIFTQPGRDKLDKAATERLETEFSDEAMTLEQVQIIDVGIPQDYQNALNEKEIAKQEVQKKEYEVQKEKQEAERKIIAARADAEANDIRDESLTEAVLTEKYIEALDEGDTVYIPVGNDDGLPKFINATAA